MSLRWRENCMGVVKSDSSSEKTWGLVGQRWEDNCKASEHRQIFRTAKEVSCGLLILRNKSVDYRVRATYSKNEWKVKVAKKEGDEISYYSSVERKWSPKNYVSFDSLDIKEENTHLWEELSHPMIVRTYQRIVLKS